MRWEEEEQVEGQGGPTPGLGAAQAGPHLGHVWHPGGSPWVAPGVSLPHFTNKKFLEIFWDFSRNFIFWHFPDFNK